MRSGARRLIQLAAIGLQMTTSAVLIAACGGQSSLAADETAGQDFARIERGRYMAAAADCAACHTDPKSAAAFAGGRRIPTPFGTLISPNITPDRETGIGGWSEAQFEAAVREGERPDGARLYPAMPFAYYRKMTHEDVAAIRAYLSTLPAVSHAVNSNQLPFPLSIRAGMYFWDALYFNDEPFKDDPQRSSEWNRGAYLVLGPGHCAACHTPKTFLGGDRQNEALQGYSLQGWFAPNITDDDALGLGRWADDQIAAFLKSGHSAVSAAAGPMGEVVTDSTSLLSEPDLHAIAVYLKGRPSSLSPGRALAAADPEMKAGAAIYQDLCSACHQSDGRGVPYMIPSLAQDSAVASREATSVIHALLDGAQSVATTAEPTGASMPAFGGHLTDEQLAAVATYIRNSWGHAAAATTADDFRKARKENPDQG
jgi:mono/diheme cytochrome c family protein